MPKRRETDWDIQRRRILVRQRRSGATFRSIGHFLGLSLSTIRNIYKEALELGEIDA